MKLRELVDNSVTVGFQFDNFVLLLEVFFTKKCRVGLNLASCDLSLRTDDDDVTSICLVAVSK